uniref:Uncharacterized protein n=1 Tax=Rhodnius prolixus TaxID=13249 RepID=T1HDN3_RHOPR
MKLLLICVWFFLVQDVFVDARPLPEEGSWFSWFGGSTSETTTEATPVVSPQGGAKRENSLFGIVLSILNGIEGPNVAVGIGLKGTNAIFTIQELGMELMRVLAAKGASLVASVATNAFQTGKQMVVDGASALYSGVSSIGSGVGSYMTGSQTE